MVTADLNTYTGKYLQLFIKQYYKKLMGVSERLTNSQSECNKVNYID